MFTEIKNMRKKKGLTQLEVAKALHCDVTVYSRYERGDREPSIDILMRLSKFYSVSIDFIVGNTNCGMLSLTKYETDLIIASREADERAREDALDMLIRHRITRKKMQRA